MYPSFKHSYTRLKNNLPYTTFYIRGRVDEKGRGGVGESSAIFSRVA